ncbi:OLC1v1020445C1 [Oldenlandia corymbosa var. corymbosa]|uniref:OLC1v1020445C1 n=1 Tax=Oldenlandia corymbosa var. corymbosa TaxID=529605 RepID=A0AAV1EGD3_OLDCO|nr:OLC1v1020445C1 [Oldenlandia corymbosa var. corymbosa]
MECPNCRGVEDSPWRFAMGNEDIEYEDDDDGYEVNQNNNQPQQQPQPHPHQQQLHPHPGINCHCWNNFLVDFSQVRPLHVNQGRLGGNNNVGGYNTYPNANQPPQVGFAPIVIGSSTRSSLVMVRTEVVALLPAQPMPVAMPPTWVAPATPTIHVGNHPNHRNFANNQTYQSVDGANPRSFATHSLINMTILLFLDSNSAAHEESSLGQGGNFRGEQPLEDVVLFGQNITRTPQSVENSSTRTQVRLFGHDLNS